MTTVNGKVAKPDTIIRNGDRIEYVFLSVCNWDVLNPLICRNVVHRHEPPITATPVRIIVHDKERQFIVIDKPGSIVSLDSLGRYGPHSGALRSQYMLPVDSTNRV